MSTMKRELADQNNIKVCKFFFLPMIDWLLLSTL